MIMHTWQEVVGGVFLCLHHFNINGYCFYYLGGEYDKECKSVQNKEGKISLIKKKRIRKINTKSFYKKEQVYAKKTQEN
jgi:hypothetical protein